MQPLPRKRMRYSIPYPLSSSSSNRIQRYDMTWRTTLSASTTQAISIFVASMPCTISIKKFYYACQLNTPASPTLNDTEIALVLGINAKSIDTGTVTIPSVGSIPAVPIYEQQNNTVWSRSLHLGVNYGNFYEGGGPEFAYVRHHPFEQDFKKLKRKMDIGDYFYFKGLSDGTGDLIPTVGMNCSCTFFVKM